MAKLKDLMGLRNNPNVQKMLGLISYAEHTQHHGYHTAFGSGRLSHLNDHPRYLKTFKQKNGKTNQTSAAGKYQFLRGTWDRLARRYGFKDFGPVNQDLAAIALLIENGAMPYVLKGDWSKAVSKSGGTWASLPSAPDSYSQPKKSWQKINDYLGGKVAPAPTVQPTGNLLVGVMGDYRLKDTGIGKGDHYDLRLARNPDGSRGDINPYLNRFIVNGKGLHTYKQTGRYMEQRKGYRHEGVDFGLNGSFGGNANARQLYVNPDYKVHNMNAFFDKKGGGWVTQVEFDDGVKVNILHQNQTGTQQVMQAWGQWGGTQQPAFQPPQLQKNFDEFTKQFEPFQIPPLN